MSFFLPNIDAMTAYVPGELPADASRVIKLNANENAYPPSPRVQEVLRSFDATGLRLYPDPMAKEFQRVAADLLGVDPTWVLPGNGSDNLIVMIARAAGGPILTPVPTFPFYETQACVEGVDLVETPFDPETFELPIDGLLAAVRERSPAVTFIANPASPTGGAAEPEQFRPLLEAADGLVVVDEAYIDFARDGISFVPLVAEYENLLVLRTLSKGYSLAGLRFGYAIARPAVLEGLAKAKEIYNVSSLTQSLATAALSDQAHKTANAAKIVAARDALAGELVARGWTVWPSETNFLLVAPPAGTAEPLYESLKARGIYVRYFNRPPLDSKLRITVGTPEQHAALLAAVDGGRS